MKTPSSIRVEPLRNSDARFAAPLDAVDDILMRAYNMPSRKMRIERYLALDSLGFVVAYCNDTLAGCGGVIAYPSGGFGWIGLVATDPNWTGRGVARGVTDYIVQYLSSIGCGAALDGSASGAPLYEKMGFVDHGITAQFEYSGALSGVAVKFASGCSLATESDLGEIIAFDTANFGADRSHLLRYLWHEFPGRWIVLRNTAGVVDGYGVAAASTIGPVVSISGRTTQALIETLCTYDYETPPRMNVPHESKFVDVVSSIDGFTVLRGLRNQRIGIGTSPLRIGGQRENLVAQCSFGEG